MRPLIRAIEGLRAIRGESNLAPSLKIEAEIQSDNPHLRATLKKWESYLKPLTGLASLKVTVCGAKPPQAAADISADMEIYVPLAGIVDLAEERLRISKEIVRAQTESGSIAKKLENPNFVAKAPPEVVEKDKARVAELADRVAKLEQNLRRIAPGEVKIAAPADGTVDLREELKDVHAAASVPAQDPHVRDALDKLRAGTKEGLSAQDHQDLGVAYMNMGLVDDAVREFDLAKKGQGIGEKTVPDRPAVLRKTESTPKAADALAPVKKVPAALKKKVVAQKTAPVAKKKPAASTAKKKPAVAKKKAVPAKKKPASKKKGKR